MWTRGVHQFILSEPEMLTSSIHLNSKWRPVRLSWTKRAINSPKSSNSWNKFFKIFHTVQMNWLTFSVQMKWTNPHLRFRRNELVNTSSSDEINWSTHPVQVNKNRSNSSSSSNWHGTVTGLVWYLEGKSFNPIDWKIRKMFKFLIAGLSLYHHVY